MIRQKNIKSGRLLEVEFYPVYGDGRRMPERAAKTKRSSKEQELYNQKQAQKKLTRLINANFTDEDIFEHITYGPRFAPKTMEDARRDMVNYLRRIKTYRRNHGLPELRYIYVIEEQVYQTGPRKGEKNFHFHLFMSGMDRDVAEKMWKKGMRVNADRFRPDRFGPEAAAKYIAKDPKGRKRFSGSKNLKKPIVSEPIDGRITKKGVEKLAKERVDDKDYWERRYKSYEFIDCRAKYNEYNGHWYVSVVLFKKTRARRN